MKITRNQVIGAAVIVVVLVAAFFWGGNYADNTPASSAPAAEESVVGDKLESLTPQSVPLTQDTATQPAEASNGGDEPTQPSAPPPEEEEADTTTPPADTGTETAPQTVEPQEPTEPPHDEPEEAAKPPQGTEAVTLQDKYSTDAVPAGMPGPVEPEDVVIGDTAYTCTLSVRCDTILDNLSMLDQNKVELVPAEGIILASITVTFYEGESVFEVLRREMKKHKIHMEFTTTPIYNSAYIEGINNLYEFDCGELSGWMYKVNGWFPNYGCSRYQLQEGDVIEWVYTCDLGRDVGDDWMGA